jgi:rare lipoprotein A
VTRLDTEQSVVVRVNDRGPHKESRVVDLSRRAAEEIDLVRSGIVDVRIELVDPDKTVTPHRAKTADPELSQQTPQKAQIPDSISHSF